MGMQGHTIFNDFRLGEASPYTEGSVNADWYRATHKKVENWVYRKENALERRLGTQTIARTYNQSIATDLRSRLKKFKTVDGTFLLEISAAASGRSAVRVYEAATRRMRSSTWEYVAGAYDDDTYTFLMPAAQSRYGAPDCAYLESQLRALDYSQIDPKTAAIRHNKHCFVLIKYDPTATGTSKFTAEYAVLNGNGWLTNDIDGNGRSTLGDDPFKSSMYVSPGIVEGPTIYAFVWNTRGPDELFACRLVSLSGVAQDYAAIVGPDWIGCHLWLDSVDETVSLGFGTYVGSSRQFLGEITKVSSDYEFGGINRYERGDPDPDDVAIAAASFRLSKPAPRTYVDMELNNTIEGFDANDEGLCWMVDDGQLEISGVTSATAAYAKVIQTYAKQNALATVGGGSEGRIAHPTEIHKFARPAWGYNDVDTYAGSVETGWPGHGCIFQGRHWCGGSLEESYVLWASQTGYYFSFKFGQDADLGIQRRLAVNTSQKITAMASGGVLFIFTEDSVFRATERTVLTPTNNAFVAELGYGAEEITPVPLDEVFVFVQTGGRQLRGITYNDSIGKIQAVHLNRYSRHITASGIVDLAGYAGEDEGYLATRDDGELVSGVFTGDLIDPISNSRFVFRDNDYTDGLTQAVVESVETTNLGGHIQTWMIIKRYINGAWVRQVEVIDDRIGARVEIGSVKSASKAFCLDNSVDWLALVSTSFFGNISVVGKKLRVNGLSSLAGQRVTAVVDNIGYPDLHVVNSGDLENGIDIPVAWNEDRVLLSATTGAVDVTFDASVDTTDFAGRAIILEDGGIVSLSSGTAGTVLQTATSAALQRWAFVDDLFVGVEYECYFRTHRPEIQLADGTSQCRPKQIIDLWARVVETRSLKHRFKSGKETKTREIKLFDNTMTDEEIEAGLTGDGSVTSGANCERDASVEIVADGPFYAAFTMLKVTYEVEPIR